MPHSVPQTLWPGTGDLLLPKLAPPRPTANLVARERLLEQMDQALVHDLTLLSASAGSGKTTLLSAWIADCPALVAWLSLEQQDNDPLRFWSYLFAALRTIEPQGGAIAMSMLQSPQPSALTTILTALINHLARSEQQIVLVLDDFHVIEHPAILSSFQFFLEHLPAPVHLVLAGRTDPHLSLSRLRAHGQVCEIRQRDLRFTQDEATSFLTQTMGILLSEDEVALLDQRAEGWIAGLQLAALASRTRETPSAFIRQLSGSQRYILEYIQEEVLERQPADWQTFLLHTSILERLNAPLCQVVMAEENVQTCQQRLEQLEQANLFLTSLDEGCRWYRFHSLFRDVLQARLQVVSPELVPLLHQRAARWYAHKGHTFEAVEHALTGADFAFATELMECAARQMWNNGEAEHLAAWLQRLPDTEFLVHGRLVLTTALQLLYQAFSAAHEQWMSMVRRTEHTMARLARLLGNQPAAFLSETEKQLLHKRLELLRGCIALKEAFHLNNRAEVRRLSTQIHEMSRDEELIWRMITTFVLRMNPPENWLQLLSELKQQAEQEGNLYEAIWITGILCDAYAQAGQLRNVHQNYIEVLRRLEQIGKAYALFGYPHLQLAHVYGEWNQRAEAHAHLQTALDFARSRQHHDMRLQGCYYALRLFLSAGEQEHAERMLTELEQVSHQPHSEAYRSMFTTAQVRVWLAQGKLAQAADWAAHTSLDLSSPHIDENKALTLVQVYLALRRHSEALRLLDELLAWTERYRHVFLRIYFLALQVVALYASGDFAQARQVAARLLILSEPEGYVYVYLEAGQLMREVLASLLAGQGDEDTPLLAIPAPYLRTLLAAFEQDKASASQHPWPETPSQGTSTSSLVTPLTPREREVLRLVAQGATNQAIAEQLVITLATAKKHVTNLLNKLGAENRVQAIAHARDKGLL